MTRTPTPPRPPFRPVNADDAFAVVRAIDAEKDLKIRAHRTRQAIFERGIALALTGSMLEQLQRLRTLREGLRWISNEQGLNAVERELALLHEDILRAEEGYERS